MRRVLAVDYGRRRIGLAVCDPLGVTVRGLATIRRDDDLESAIRQVAEQVRAADVQLVLMGLPLHTDGRESDMSAEVRRFATRLEEQIEPPLEWVDEGLTSWEAEENLRERGVRLSQARREGLIDQEAACCLLRAWLRERGGRTGGEPRDP